MGSESMWAIIWTESRQTIRLTEYEKGDLVLVDSIYMSLHF